MLQLFSRLIMICINIWWRGCSTLFDDFIDYEKYHRAIMLNFLNLDSLEKKVAIDWCFIFELINGISDCPQLLSQISINVPH